jgi:hypothetical protein
MLAENLSEEDTSAVRNVTFGSAGTADTFYRLIQKIIHPSVRCVVENLVLESKVCWGSGHQIIGE